MAADDDARAADILAAKRGLWISLMPVDACDQTIESAMERSAFFPVEMPEAARERLARLDRLMDGREAEVAPAFGAALDLAWSEKSPTHRGIARRVRLRQATLAAGGAERDAVGLSFAHYPDPEGRHWGGLAVFFEGESLLRSNEDDFWAASPKSQACGREIFEALADAFLRGIAAQWGLGDPSLAHRRLDSRIHWQDDWPPSCLTGPDNSTAMALMEGADIASGLCKPSEAKPRRPL